MDEAISKLDGWARSSLDVTRRVEFYDGRWFARVIDYAGTRVMGTAGSPQELAEKLGLVK